MAFVPHTIKLKSYGDVFNEYAAAAALKPGHLLEITSAGTVRKHSGAGKTAIAMFAIEDALQGKSIEDAYATGDQVRVWTPRPGDEVYARIADEVSVAVGDYLESNGLGELRAVSRSLESWESADSQSAKSLYDKHVIGQVLEAVNNTSQSTDESELNPAYNFVKIRIV